MARQYEGQVGSINLRSKDTSQQVSNNTTNTMDCEDIESFIDVENELQLGCKVACNATNNTEDDSGPRSDETGARSDGNQSGNSTRAETNDRPLALEAVIEEHPGNSTHGGGKVGSDERHDRTDVGAQRGATVETKPTNPQEDGAENNHGDVVRSVRQAGGLGVAGALAEHDGHGESCGAGRDVDGRATGIIETTHLEGPAVRVPGPESDRVVDNSRPNENEDDGGENAHAINSRTDGESRAVWCC